MQVNLRQRRQYGLWRGMGDGDPEGSIESQLIAAGVDPIDAAQYSELPGGSTSATTTPLPEFSPDELAAEQARAFDWLKTLPNIINAAGKITMSAAQLAAGIQAGTIKPSTTCPSGYLVGTECVAPVAQPVQASLIPGLPNSTLAMIGGGLLILVLISKSGGRR